MRIALLASSMGAGGAERVASTLANAWAGMGREVFLVPTFLGSDASGYATQPGVVMAPLAGFFSEPLARVCGRTSTKLRAMRKLISSISPDVVISFLTNVNVMTIVALTGMDKPLIISERADVTARVEMPKILDLARRAIYQFADALVVQTEDAALRYRRCIYRIPQTSVIANPLPRELHEDRRRVSHGDGGGEIVAMGRLVAQKQFDQLIMAFAQVFRTETAWKLTIWGEGPLRKKLEDLVVQLQMQERVRLPGVTSSPWDRMASAQIFALTSAYEGFPNSMLEAMALGMPCVAYDCPTGPKELSDNGAAAVLVPSGDVASLAGALRMLADEPTQRMQIGQLAAQSVRERFSQAAILSKWDNLFGTLLNRGSVARGRAI